jgi:hypothetical protein
MGTWIIQKQYTFESGETEEVFVGPFSSGELAVEWLDAQPDEEELTEAFVWYMNSPKSEPS